MKNILKFIYNKEDKGIYRIRTILGIKITTKPKELSYNIIPYIIKNKNYVEKKYKLAIFLRFGIGDYILFRKFCLILESIIKNIILPL